MKRHLLLITFLIQTSVFAQVTVSYELIQTYSVENINSLITEMGLPSGIVVPEYGVDFYRVLYTTEYKDSMVVVSGAMVVPKNMTCPAPLTSYMHGTTSKKLNVPSYNSSEKEICILFASEGNVSPSHHPAGSRGISPCKIFSPSSPRSGSSSTPCFNDG
jgi:hypothetical protein